MSLDDLQMAEYNPRNISAHDFKALKKSIETFGDLSGIIKNITTGNLVGGHQRVRAFRDLESAEIVVDDRLPEPNSKGTVARGYVLMADERYTYREVEWPLEFEQAANVAANRIQGEWNKDMLAELIYQMDEEMREATGHTQEEIDKLLDMVSGTDDDKDDEAPAIDDQTPPVSKEGEIYQLGAHRLMCGDSTSTEHLSQLMQGNRAAMTFTDPPYNINYQGGAGAEREGIKNDNMSKEDFYTFLSKMIANALSVTDGATYICMSPAEMDTLKRAFEQNGGHFQSFIIWAKNTFTLSGSDYQHQYEPILYGWKEGDSHYYVGQRDLANVWQDLQEIETTYDGEYTSIKIGLYEVKILGKPEGMVQKKQLKGDLWRVDKPIKSEDHPTMKPLALCMEAIKNSSQRTQIVLDLFGGSGSTLIASDKIDRVCYMMELDPKYCDVIRKRYAKHAGYDDWIANTPPTLN